MISRIMYLSMGCHVIFWISDQLFVREMIQMRTCQSSVKIKMKGMHWEKSSCHRGHSEIDDPQFGLFTMRWILKLFIFSCCYCCK